MTATALSRRKSTEVAGLADRMPALPSRAAPPLKVGRLILVLFVMGFGLFGVLGTWAATAPMTSAIIAPGLFKAAGDKRVVQHLEGGIVRELLVAEGARVHEGAILLRLDETRARASLGILHNQLAGALATKARLQAEFAQSDEIAVPPELAALIAAEPSFAEFLETQRAMFDSGTQISEGQVGILQDRIAQLEEQRIGIDSRIVALEGQLYHLQDEIESYAQLYENGLITKTRYLALRREEAALMGDIAIAQADLQTVLQQVAEIEGQKLQVRRDRLSGITAGLQELGETIFDIRQRIDATEDTLDRLSIRAPVSGRIVGLELSTLGEIVAGGQRLMEIVPDDGTLAIEARVHPNDIDQVFEGSAARVRLTAYNFRTTPIVTGVVTHVSADSLADERSGETYFRADVKLDDDALDALPDVEIQPGMPAQVMIATGEQTLADYLLRPITGGLEIALTESN